MSRIDVSKVQCTFVWRKIFPATKPLSEVPDTYWLSPQSSSLQYHKILLRSQNDGRGVDQGKFQNGRICNCIWIGRLTANFKGCLQLEEDWLAEEELPGLEAQAPDLRLCQLNILPWPRSPHCNKNIKLKTNYLGIWWSMGYGTLVAWFLWCAEQCACGKLMKSMAVAKVWRHTMAMAYWQGVRHR